MLGIGPAELYKINSLVPTLKELYQSASCFPLEMEGSAER